MSKSVKLVTYGKIIHAGLLGGISRRMFRSHILGVNEWELLRRHLRNDIPPVRVVVEVRNETGSRYHIDSLHACIIDFRMATTVNHAKDRTKQFENCRAVLVEDFPMCYFYKGETLPVFKFLRFADAADLLLMEE